MNEAAILAAKEQRLFIKQADINKAFIKVGIGAEKKSRIISDKENALPLIMRQAMRSCSTSCRMWDRSIRFP
jgi:ATP-dependent Zn protease